MMIVGKRMMDGELGQRTKERKQRLCDLCISMSMRVG